jgi:hypothetical protein
MARMVAVAFPPWFQCVAMPKPGKAEKQAARSERLSAALRQNLKRRKEQARARERAPGQEMDQQAGQASPPQGAETEASPEFRRNPVRE